MSKTGVVRIHNKDYKTVVLRVNEFREQCPVASGWGIDTKIVELTDKWACVRATIVDPAGKLVGSGHGVEFWDGAANKINKTSALENAETSAIGRALASIGLGGEEYASADEVINAIKTQKTMEEPVKEEPKEIEVTSEIINGRDLVKENYKILAKYLGEDEAIKWHKALMNNYFSGKMRDDLDTEELEKLAYLQNERIKTVGKD